MADPSTPRALPARRACLVVPGSSPEKLAKAARRGADEVVVDLEDAVAPVAKERARRDVVAALAGDWGGATVSVRVNAPGTPWCHEDIAALAAAPAPPHGIVVPKVESAGDLAFVDRLLDGVEAAAPQRPAPLRVQALIETAAGVVAAHEIAAASPRLEALIVGYADLAASLGRSPAGAADVGAWDAVRDAVLMAARAAGVQAIDGPYLAIAADDAFAASARRARDLGFDGKWAIHPAQVAPLVELFTPTAEEVADARAIVAALESAEREGAGAVALDGRMIDEALRAGALRLLARAGAA